MTPSVPLVGDRNLRGKEETAPSRRSKPLRFKVGGASDPSPDGFAGWDHRDKVDGALRNLLITFRFSAIFLVISGKRYIFAEKSNV